jgi:transcriptional regulator with XRE-family HTH domain
MGVVILWTVNGLRELRRKKGMTLRQLADEIGIHENSLARYQNGHRNPHRIVRRLLAGALGVSESEIDKALAK